MLDKFRKIISNPKYTVFFILAVALAFRLPFVIFPYWGLEYEDSYIFSVTSRLINENYDFSYDIFFTKYISLGSINEYIKMSTISGHFIFFPVLLAGINNIFSFSPFNVLYINSALSLLSIYFLLKSYIIVIPNKGFFLFGILLSTIPFLSIYNTTGLSETFSSLFISLSLYTFLLSKKYFFKDLNYTLTFIFIFSISIFIKRDNLILLIWPFYEVVSLYLKKDFTQFKRLLSISIMILILAFISSIILDVDKTVIDEKMDIGRNPFGFDFLVQLLPTFIGSLFHFKFFSITGIILLVSLFTTIRKKDLEFLPFLLIFISFVLIYSLHYRSYYMIHGDFVPTTFDTFRYYTNFYSLILIYSCLVITKHYSYIFKKFKITVAICSIALIGLNFYNTLIIRENYSNEENQVRFQPVLTTLEKMKENDVIVTDIPILFQLLGSKTIKIVDLTLLNQDEINFIKENLDLHSVFALLENDEDFRYNKKDQLLKNFDYTKILDVPENYSLFELKN